MILENKFLYLTPFQKRLHSVVTDISSLDIVTFKQSLSSLREATTDMDLTRIVEPYLDPWWITSSPKIVNPDLFPDVPRFRNMVTLHLIRYQNDNIFYE
jgi:hypothetical protein